MREDDFREKVTDSSFLDWGLGVIGKDMSYTRLNCFSSLYSDDRVIGEMMRAYKQLLSAMECNRKRGAISIDYRSKG